MTPTPQELKELAEVCQWLSDTVAFSFSGNLRAQLRRIHELLAKLAEEELGK